MRFGNEDHRLTVRVAERFVYAHPIFTQAGVDAQERWQQVNGQRRTWFCGAWWGKGFHEDGVNSAIKVAKALGCASDWE